MRNEKKIVYLENKIKELEQQVAELRQENLALNTQLDVNKRTILLKEQSLDKQKQFVEDMQKEYTDLLAELRNIHIECTEVINTSKNTKNKFIAEMQQQLNRIKKKK